MITLEQLLNDTNIEANCIDIHSWNPEIWDYDDFFGFCDNPNKEFILSRVGELKNYIVKSVEAVEQQYDNNSYIRIEVQKSI